MCAVSSSCSSPLSGRCDSYALQVRLDRYQSSPTRAVGTSAATASRLSGLGPPAALLRRQEAEPGPPTGALGCARALPGHQVEGDLADRGGQQHGQAERDEPHHHAVQPHRRGAAPRRGPHPVGEVDHHEGEQQQPQGAGAVSRGEVGPAVGLGDGSVPVAFGVLLGLDVFGTPVDGGRRVTGDPGRTGVAEHLLGSGSADAVDEQFQRCPGALRGLGGRGQCRLLALWSCRLSADGEGTGARRGATD